MRFQELITRIGPKLHAIAKRLDGTYTVFDEDDLYQQALLHLWEQYQNRQVVAQTESFILQGCYYFLKNYIRKAYKTIDRRSWSLDYPLREENDSFQTFISSTTSEQERSAIDVDLLLEEIHASLSPRERRVFSFNLGGLTRREIGRQLGISHVMVIKIEKKIRQKCRHLREEIGIH